jgi:RNA polymerase sigma-70 factor (ECF subfamily)
MATVTQTQHRTAPSATGALAPVALEAIVQQYSRYVATIGFRILGRRGELDDLLQEVFLEAHRTLPQLRDPQALPAWLATVTVRSARRMLRMRSFAHLLMPFGAAPAFDPVDPTASAEERHVLGRLYSVLDRVPASWRVAWVLKTMEGESLDKVAELCGCSVAAVKRRVAKAQAVLDEELGHA